MEMEPLNTKPANLYAAHSLYVLFETLPEQVQREFLSELWQKKGQQLENIKPQSVTTNHRNGVVIGIMEGELSIPDNFDEPLPGEVENLFYRSTL